MMKKKILISSRYSIFNQEGTSVRAKRMFNVLQSNFHVQLITTANRSEELDTKNKNSYILIKPKNSKMWLFKIIPKIIRNKFDIVICENDWMGFPIYWIFSKIFRYKIIFEAHGILSDEANDWEINSFIVKLYVIIEKFCIKHSNLVIALSNEIKDKYKEYNYNIKLIPVFIDDLNYKPNINHDKKKVGIIGPFGSKRNMYYAPDFIFKNINKFDEKIQFIIIGECDKKYENSRIQKLGYIDSFNRYIQSIANLDALIVIEKRKTSGPLNKILEAMSCETPVFTTPEGALGLDKIKSGKNLIISPEKYIINKVNNIIFDEQKLNEISKNAKELFEDYYSIKANKSNIINLLQKI